MGFKGAPVAEENVASLSMRDRVIIGLITLILGGSASAVTARSMETRVTVLETKASFLDPIQLDRRLTRIETALQFIYREQTGNSLPIQ